MRKVQEDLLRLPQEDGTRGALSTVLHKYVDTYNVYVIWLLPTGRWSDAMV